MTFRFSKTSNHISKSSLYFWMSFFILSFWACGEVDTNQRSSQSEMEIPFNQAKWKTKEGTNYPFRNQMLQAVLHNDSIRSLNKTEILDLLGEPSYDREDPNFLHYQIHQTRLGFWPLHSKVLVIKFSEDLQIDWIKIHE